jgi:hypothetical protein
LVGHEDIFIARVTQAYNIPERHHFHFDHKWVAQNSETKPTAVRYLKANRMNPTAEAELTMSDLHNNQ